MPSPSMRSQRRASAARPASARRGALCRAVVVAAAVLVVGASALPLRAATVAVLLSADVAEYQKAIEGFRQANTGGVTYETYDMKGDFDRGRQLLAEIEKAKPDLIYTVGIWALQLVSRHETKIPVVYAMVLNPPSILQDSAARITGASMNVSVTRTFQILKQLNPKLKRVGTVYDPRTTGYLVRDAKAAAAKEGIELVAKEIHSAKEAIGALSELQKQQVDVLWILPDKAVLAPTVMEQMLLFSYRNRVPLVGLSERQAEMGTMLALSFASSEDIGRQAGELAASILAGKSASDLPRATARQINLVVNLKVARKLGVDVPDSVLKQASSVIR